MAAVRARLLPRARRLQSSNSLYSKLDGYQKSAVEFAVEAMTAALLFEQGTGKTWIAGGIIERLFDPSFIGLMVVPLGNLESTWLKFLTSQLPQVPAYRTWEAFKVAPVPKLLLVHYEVVAPIISKLRRVKWKFIGYDEAQRLKNRASLQSRTAAKLRACAPYKVILTGTPIEENPCDLWAQFKFLRPEVFGDAWKDFANYYLEPLDPNLEKRFKEARPGSFKWEKAMREMRIANGKRDFDFDKLDEFIDAITPYAMRVTKSVLNLPPMTTHRVPVVLRGEQRHLYEDLSRNMVASIAGETITAPLRVTLLGRLQQICGGYIVDDLGRSHEAGRAKMRALLRLIKRQPKPIVVFCRYLEEVWAIRDELHDTTNLRVETLTGKVKIDKRSPLIIEFQAGEIDVLICQIKTGGVGIDLFRATVAIFYSYTYGHIDFDQAMSRLHRRGQEYAVDLFLIFARNTVDEDILQALMRKRKITSRVLDKLEQQRRNHYGFQKGAHAPRRRKGIQVRYQRPREGTRPGAGNRARHAASA